MTTGDTITDAQIRALMESVRGIDYDAYRIAQQALEWSDHARRLAKRATTAPGTLDVAQISIMANHILGTRWERARCAEILNTRKTKVECVHEWSVDEQGTRRCIGCGAPK